MSDEELSKFFDAEYNKYSKLFKGAVCKVLRDVRAEIEEQIDRYDDRNISEYEDCLAIIDRKIAEIKGDKPFRYAKEIIEAQSPPSEGVNGEEFEKWLREGDKND